MTDRPCRNPGNQSNFLFKGTPRYATVKSSNQSGRNATHRMNAMRTYMHINLNDRTIEKEKMEGEQLARAGRYHIVKTMLDRNLAEVDP